MNGPLGFSECILKKQISNQIKYQTDQYTIWIKPGKARTCQPTSGSSPFYCKHDFFAKRRDAAMCAIWRSLGSKFVYENHCEFNEINNTFCKIKDFLRGVFFHYNSQQGFFSSTSNMAMKYPRSFNTYLAKGLWIQSWTFTFPYFSY